MLVGARLANHDSEIPTPESLETEIERLEKQHGFEDLETTRNIDDCCVDQQQLTSKFESLLPTLERIP